MINSPGRHRSPEPEKAFIDYVKDFANARVKQGLGDLPMRDKWLNILAKQINTPPYSRKSITGKEITNLQVLALLKDSFEKENEYLVTPGDLSPAIPEIIPQTLEKMVPWLTKVNASLFLKHSELEALKKDLPKDTRFFDDTLNLFRQALGELHQEMQQLEARDTDNAYDHQKELSHLSRSINFLIVTIEIVRKMRSQYRSMVIDKALGNGGPPLN